MDDAWTGFEVAFYRVVERFVREAGKLPLVPVQVPRWEFAGNGRFQYVRTPVFWTDQSLGMLMPHWEEFIELDVCARQSHLVNYMNVMVGGSGIRVAFDLVSFTLGTIGDALRTTASSVDFDSTMVRTRLSLLRQAINDENVETEILILIDGVQLEDDVDLGDGLSVRCADAVTMTKFLQTGMLPAFDSENTPTIERPDNEWVVLRKAYLEPKVVGRAPGARVFRGSASEVAAIEFERFADALAVMRGRRPRLVGWLERLSNEALSRSWSSGTSAGRARAPAILSSPDAGRIRSIWHGVDAVSKFPKAKAVAMAVRRMGFASMRERWEDRFLDVMIALEALLLSDPSPERGELRFRMAFRAAQSLPNGVGDFTSGEIFIAMKHAYDVRSALAHGGDANGGEVFNIRGRKISLEALLGLVSEIGRSLTESAIEAVLRDKRYFIDWEGQLTAYFDLKRK